MSDIEFAWGTRLEQERDRRSDLPIVRNGPPGTFVILGDLRISLPTDQIVHADAAKGYASVSFGGMSFNGAVSGRLVFTRVRELHPEHELSPDRSHTMLLNPEWVATVAVNDKRVWPEIVYKIVPAALWQASEASDSFAGLPVDQQDGFIHFSTAPQVRATAAKHFAGARDLLLVAASISTLDLRWETSRGGDRFPHLYGPMPRSAVRWVRELPLGADGHHVFPALE